MNFSLWDFIYPVQIVVLKRKLSITEKYSHTKLVELQNEQLQKLINYVYLHVPYYKELFDINKINPEKIRTIKDLSYIPVLTKQNLRENFAALTCDKE
ncbi:MAG: phenylacetate--CoA ligase, partial [Actinobacteria bacterium]|nr:phenylacetate--CoA ligase [Actinomycetota bacterium]